MHSRPPHSKPPHLTPKRNRNPSYKSNCKTFKRLGIPHISKKDINILQIILSVSLELKIIRIMLNVLYKSKVAKPDATYVNT